MEKVVYVPASLMLAALLTGGAVLPALLFALAVAPIMAAVVATIPGQGLGGWALELRSRFAHRAAHDA